jgi:hypothetical protein
MQVETEAGMIDLKDLEIREEYQNTDEGRLTKTQMLHEGNVVREHVNENKWRGLDPAKLTFRDTVTSTDNSRDHVSEWIQGGEVVRRNVNVTILRGLSLSGDQARI